MLCLMADKKVILNLRLKSETRDDFAIAAELRGATMSGLLHQFIVRTIREEKEAAPHQFRIKKTKNLAPVVGRISSEKAEKDRIRRMLADDDQRLEMTHKKRRTG